MMSLRLVRVVVVAVVIRLPCLAVAVVVERALLLSGVFLLRLFRLKLLPSVRRATELR